MKQEDDSNDELKRMETNLVSCSFISLPCRPSDSLDWEIPEVSGQIIWRFELGLEDLYFPLEDEMRFESLRLALEKFSREIWPKFQDRTQGVILYQGTADFSLKFLWTERQETNWSLWLQERPNGSEKHLKRLFCADAFVHYFQMLSYRLPDELPAYLFLDGSGIGTLAERHHLVSKGRFEHFQLAVKGIPNFRGLDWSGEKLGDEALVGVCFPEEEICDQKTLEKIDELMKKISGEFRVIHEPFLTEEWDGVDVLHVLKEAIGSRGERKLMGFKAAGGKVIEWN